MSAVLEIPLNGYFVSVLSIRRTFCCKSLTEVIWECLFITSTSSLERRMKEWDVARVVGKPSI